MISPVELGRILDLVVVAMQSKYGDRLTVLKNVSPSANNHPNHPISVTVISDRLHDCM
jgi:hypothetical protein